MKQVKVCCVTWQARLCAELAPSRWSQQADSAERWRLLSLLQCLHRAVWNSCHPKGWQGLLYEDEDLKDERSTRMVAYLKKVEEAVPRRCMFVREVAAFLINVYNGGAGDAWTKEGADSFNRGRMHDDTPAKVTPTKVTPAKVTPAKGSKSTPAKRSLFGDQPVSDSSS